MPSTPLREAGLIAVVRPGHYVLVEAVFPTFVEVWDPGSRPSDVGVRRRYEKWQWGRAWEGVALRLAPPQ